MSEIETEATETATIGLESSKTVAESLPDEEAGKIFKSWFVSGVYDLQQAEARQLQETLKRLEKSKMEKVGKHLRNIALEARELYRTDSVAAHLTADGIFKELTFLRIIFKGW